MKSLSLLAGRTVAINKQNERSMFMNFTSLTSAVYLNKLKMTLKLYGHKFVEEYSFSIRI